MTTRPTLVRSIPFWVLLAGSVVSIAAGAWLAISKAAVMTSTLTDQTATGVEVYVGQVLVVAGAILVGVGLIGLALALTLAVLRSFLPAAPLEVVAPIDWADESDDAEITEAPVAAVPAAPAAPVVDLGYTAAPIEADVAKDDESDFATAR